MTTDSARLVAGLSTSSATVAAQPLVAGPMAGHDAAKSRLGGRHLLPRVGSHAPGAAPTAARPRADALPMAPTEQARRRLGAALEAMRESAGLTRAQVATAAGMSSGGVRNAETGRYGPRRVTLLRWLAALGVIGDQAEAFLSTHHAGITPLGRVTPRPSARRRRRPAWNDRLAPPPASIRGPGRHLWLLRLEARLGRADVAEIIGSTRSHVHAVERGQRRPSADLLARWCAVLSPEDPALAVRLMARWPNGPRMVALSGLKAASKRAAWRPTGASKGTVIRDLAPDGAPNEREAAPDGAPEPAPDLHETAPLPAQPTRAERITAVHVPSEKPGDTPTTKEHP